MSDSKVDTGHAPVENLSEKLANTRPSFVVDECINDKSHFKASLVNSCRIVHVLSMAQIAHATYRVKNFFLYSHVETLWIIFHVLFFSSYGYSVYYLCDYTVYTIH